MNAPAPSSTPVPGRTRLFRAPVFWFALLFFVASAPFVAWYPLPSGDEIIGNDPAAEWVQHGQIKSSVFGELPGYERGYFLQPPGQFLTAAAAYAIAGVSIESTRINALLWAAGALFAWGWLATRWTGSPRAGVFCALLIACIPVFGHSVAAARMDAQALCLVGIALLLWLPDRQATAARPFVAGLFLGAGGLTHPVVIFWAFGLGAAALFSGRSERRLQLLWLIAGAALPLAAWLGVASRYPAEFAQQFMRHGEGKLGGADLGALAIGESVRAVKAFAQQPLLLALYVVGAIAWWRRHADAPGFRRETTIIALVLTAGITFGLEKASGPHLMHYAVALSLAAAAWLDRSLQAAPPAPAWLKPLALASLLLVAGLGAARWALPRFVAVTVQQTARDHAAFTSELARIIPPGSNVAGEPIAWYAIRANDSWLRLAVTPDPQRHHFVVFQAEHDWTLAPEFERIATVGHPLPAWHGRTFSPSEELHVIVARSRVLPPPPQP